MVLLLVYLIKYLHQITAKNMVGLLVYWYILSSIYIKSQPRPVKALKFKTFHEIQARKNADFCFLGADLMSFSDFNISKNKCIKKVPIV